MNRLKAGKHIVKAIYKGKSNPGITGDLFIDAIVVEPVGNFEE